MHHQLHERWCPDLLRDPVMRFLERTFVFWHVFTAFVLFGIGFMFDGVSFGIFVGDVGVVRPTSLRVAFDLARQFGQPYVGLSKLRDF